MYAALLFVVVPVGTGQVPLRNIRKLFSLYTAPPELLIAKWVDSLGYWSRTKPLMWLTEDNMDNISLYLIIIRYHEILFYSLLSLLQNQYYHNWEIYLISERRGFCPWFNQCIILVTLYSVYYIANTICPSIPPTVEEIQHAAADRRSSGNFGVILTESNHRWTSERETIFSVKGMLIWIDVHIVRNIIL